MQRIRMVTFVLLSGLVACQSGKPDWTKPQAIIAAAQAKSLYGATPNWLTLTDKPDLFKGVRDRAYGYCLSDMQIDMECASKQDEAVEASVMALHLASVQAKMTNMETLGLKERWVAENPEIAQRVTTECWAFYKEHGAADARLLAICLGNLTDYSPLIPLPVP